MDIREEVVQVQDRVAYHLSQSVVGDIAPTVDLIEGDMLGLEEVLPHKQVLHVAAFSEGQYMGMFYKNQVVRSRGWVFSIAIRRFLVDSSLEERFLSFPSLFIVFQTPINKGNFFVHL